MNPYYLSVACVVGLSACMSSHQSALENPKPAHAEPRVAVNTENPNKALSTTKPAQDKASAPSSDHNQPQSNANVPQKEALSTEKPAQDKASAPSSDHNQPQSNVNAPQKEALPTEKTAQDNSPAQPSENTKPANTELLVTEEANENTVLEIDHGSNTAKPEEKQEQAEKKEAPNIPASSNPLETAPLLAHETDKATGFQVHLRGENETSAAARTISVSVWDDDVNHWEKKTWTVDGLQVGKWHEYESEDDRAFLFSGFEHSIFGFADDVRFSNGALTTDFERVKGQALYRGYGMLKQPSLTYFPLAAEFNVDFDAKTLTGTLEGYNDTFKIQANIKNDGTFAGEIDGVKNKGAFYGADASELVGEFQKDKTFQEGVFGARK